MLLDPTQFSIIQSKEMGLWPPSDIVAHGVWPYINRLKEVSIRVLDVGVMKGENAAFLLENDKEKKIEKIYGVVSYDPARKTEFENYEKILRNNMQSMDRFSLGDTSKSFHVVCIHADSDLDITLEKYYDTLYPNGIFCGNEHGQVRVKEALGKFRRKNKIGTPIMVANDCWFWYKRKDTL